MDTIVYLVKIHTIEWSETEVVAIRQLNELVAQTVLMPVVMNIKILVLSHY